MRALVATRTLAIKRQDIEDALVRLVVGYVAGARACR